jgi:hypothetical protein
MWTTSWRSLVRAGRRVGVGQEVGWCSLQAAVLLLRGSASCPHKLSRCLPPLAGFPAADAAGKQKKKKKSKGR